MPKAATRFRNRKINFRTRISIRTGAFDLPSDHEDDELAFEDERKQSMGSSHLNDKSHVIETGVDKEEESELHLQKVINASTAALLGSAIKQRDPLNHPIISDCTNNIAPDSSLASHLTSNHDPAQITPHIPIPDATGLVDPKIYESLYAHSKIFLPSSYIRFSDTVEDTLGGVVYTMDDQDQTWLDQFNSENGHPNESSKSSIMDDISKIRRSNARKGKEKERIGLESEGLGQLSDLPGPLSENDFEALMDHFEKVTEETVPGLHLDTNRLPSSADLEHSLEGPLIPPRLLSIKIFAKFVYSHWKERRLKRGGKPIMPAIDFDESNENNPYVCFRRREIKMVRKTRRTDSQNLGRLIRLRNDLYKAQELLNTVAARERIKREAAELEKAIFEGRCLVRELKRGLNQADGDEELLVSKKEKRRKRDESGNRALKSPTRKPINFSHNGPTPEGGLVQDVHFLREQAKATAKLMEREFNRCREEQSGWEDFTDSAHLPMSLSAAALRWRGPLCLDSLSTSKTNRESSNAIEQGLTTNATIITPLIMENNQFRKRVGRGGRFLLDRIIAPRQRTWISNKLRFNTLDQTQQDIRHRRLTDRWRYDDDLRNEFPSVDDPCIIDDYSIAYSSKRRNLLEPDDLECLEPHSEVYLAKAKEYLDRVPDPEPPVVRIGKLPGKVTPNLYGGSVSFNRNTTHASSLQEQNISSHLSAQASVSRLNPKRTPSGYVSINNNNLSDSPLLGPPARIQRNPSSQSTTPPNVSGLGIVPINSNGKSSSHEQQTNPLGWQNSGITCSSTNQNANSPKNGIATTTAMAGGNLTSVGPSQHGPSSQNTISISFPLNVHNGGLSRSIPVPANNFMTTSRPITGTMNVLGVNPILSTQPIPRPRSSSSNLPQQPPPSTIITTTTPASFISRPGSASSHSSLHQAAPQSHSSPNVTNSRSTKTVVASSLGQTSYPPSSNHLATPHHLQSRHHTSPSRSTTPNEIRPTTTPQSVRHSSPSPHVPPSPTTLSPGSLGANAAKATLSRYTHHSPIGLVPGHPSSPRLNHPGNVFNPIFPHQQSPSQGAQNGPTATATTGFS
ncbi:hypothetical protein O181_039490 [Austropuccinia psidii MF-1]|uniref:Enhancer of polycomb-like protein n=1 Tax=Austropuccinia psidii MF-1 TaxID=1389203 RepID=A0A9Q3DF03_9BASI|nr:hypothetical protein [Austropuccinia psidii MF-1]